MLTYLKRGGSGQDMAVMACSHKLNEQEAKALDLKPLLPGQSWVQDSQGRIWISTDQSYRYTEADLKQFAEWLAARGLL